jgi:hypothetical protein
LGLWKVKKILKNVSKNKGFFVLKRQHGKGKYILPDGTYKIGVWEDGKRLRWLENES